MKILLTGPNSFSGQVILKYFLKKNHDVTIISRQKSDKKFADNVHVINCDITRIDSLDGGFDAVVHIAATSPMFGVTSVELIQDNILATQNLINCIKNSGVKKFIFFSTCSAYGDINQSVLSESTPISNPCTYGASKLMCEALLREQKTFQSLAIRLPAIIGQGASRHWLANTIKKAKSDEPILIYNPEALFNNAIHINTLSCFIECLLQKKWPYSFDYINVASKEGMSISTIVDKIITKMRSGSEVSIGRTEKPPFIISTQYAENVYGFEPRVFSDELDCYLDAC